MSDDTQKSTGPAFSQAFAGALLGSVVNVLLHFIGPQRTREMLHTVFALSDRHRETPCPGECTFSVELEAVLGPYLTGLLPDDGDVSRATTIVDCLVDMVMLTTAEADQMVAAVFHMQGVDPGRVAVPGVA